MAQWHGTWRARYTVICFILDNREIMVAKDSLAQRVDNLSSWPFEEFTGNFTVPEALASAANYTIRDSKAGTSKASRSALL